MLQCVAVCCSVLHWVLRQQVGVLQCVAVCCSVLHRVLRQQVGVLKCIAVCCSLLQCVAVCCSVFQCVAVCCSVLQCVAVCCSVLQRACTAQYAHHVAVGAEFLFSKQVNLFYVCVSMTFATHTIPSVCVCQ